jgi:hypothetical protein
MGTAQNARHGVKSAISGPPQSTDGGAATRVATAPALDKMRFLEASPYESDGGHLIGKDPREMTTSDWGDRVRLVGLRAIRAKCLDCSAGQPSEIRKCVAFSCVLWPLRMGTVPPSWRGTGEQ